MVATLNRQLYATTAPEKYATFYFALYDEAAHSLTYTNAGHLAPMLLRGSDLQMLDSTGTVVGAFPLARYEEKTVALEHGDMLVAYTDGIVEPENVYGEMFGEERLKDLLVKYAKRGFVRDDRAHHGGGGAVDRRRRIAGRYDYGGGAAYMKVLTAAEMREVDRRTIEAGIPGIVLMENAGHRVVEFLAERFAPLADAAHRGALRQGEQRRRRPGGGAPAPHALRPRALHVVLLADPEDLKGDAAANLPHAAGLRAARCSARSRRRRARATLVVDALLGTGISGPATGACCEGIREINRGFPLAKVVAVDIPSGMPSDSGEPAGEFARADYTVTFTAPKVAQVLPPNCDHVGELVVGAIGSPPELYDGRVALAGGARDVPRTAGAARARRAQGDVRPRAGGGGIARQDGRGGDGRAWPRCGRARGW